MDFRPIDADNHYYEPLDAFTRHLDTKFNDRGRAAGAGRQARPAADRAARSTASSRTRRSTRSSCPAASTRCSAARSPRASTRARSCRSSRCAPSTRTATRRVEVMDEQGLGAALLFPTLGLRRRGGAARRHPGDDGEPVARSTAGSRRTGASTTRTGSSPRRCSRSPIPTPRSPRSTRCSSAARASSTSGPRRCPGRTAPSRSLGDKLHDPVWARLAEASVPVAFHLGDSGYNAAFAAAWGGSADVRLRQQRPARRRCWSSDRAIHDTIASLDRPRRVQPAPDAAGGEHRERLGLDARAGQAPAQAGQPDAVGVRRGPARHAAPRTCGSRRTSRRTSARWPT